jgi:hypothetical protein
MKTNSNIFNIIFLNATFNIKVYINIHKDGQSSSAEGYIWTVLALNFIPNMQVPVKTCGHFRYQQQS